MSGRDAVVLAPEEEGRWEEGKPDVMAWEASWVPTELALYKYDSVVSVSVSIELGSYIAVYMSYGGRWVAQWGRSPLSIIPKVEALAQTKHEA